MLIFATRRDSWCWSAERSYSRSPEFHLLHIQVAAVAAAPVWKRAHAAATRTVRELQGELSENYSSSEPNPREHQTAHGRIDGA